MTPARIKALRAALGENRATFAARVHKSHRTIEAWELGTRRPDALARSILEPLAQRVDGHGPPRKPRP